MLPLKTIIALSVMPLLLTSAGRTSAQMLTDAYTLAETSADMPVTWEPWLAMNNSRRGESARLSEHHWVGRGEKGKKPDEPQKRKCGSGQVLIVLCHSPVEARANVEEWLKPGRMAVSPVRGSYTGAPLGDECLRCKVEPNGAYLRFCRGNAFFMVDVGGHQGCFDYPALAEKIARSLLTRTDAALALAASESNPVTTSLRPVGTRRPRGVPVMLVDEWAADAGASLQADWKSGMATVKRGAHKLRLMVGRRDALLDGKTVTLPFPALRYGKDRLWCPVVRLEQAYRLKRTSADVETSRAGRRPVFVLPACLLVFSATNWYTYADPTLLLTPEDKLLQLLYLLAEERNADVLAFFD